MEVYLADSEKIENVQKSIIKFLLGYQDTSYSEACEMFMLDKLSIRRNKLCKKLHLKISKNLSLYMWRKLPIH